MTSRKVIVIDPGHGGDDRANKGPTTYVEADGNLAIALKVKQKLAKYQNVSIILTRQYDVTMSLTDRGMMGANSDVFLSIHSNACNNSSVRGTEVYYSVDIEDDYEWAGMLSRLISDAFTVDNRGPKTRESLVTPDEDYYTVIDEAQDHNAKHVLLLESLFHSNMSDESLLLSDHGQTIIADLIVETIACMLQLVEDKDETVSEWAVEAHAWVVANEISLGLRPKDNATREEIWTMLHRAYLLD